MEEYADDKRRLLERRIQDGIAKLGEKKKFLSGNSTVHGDEDLSSDYYEPFPLTDMQEAYWIGRNSELGLGGTSIHSYRESDIDNLDLGRLNDSWNVLVKRHHMLRAVVTAEGSQRILKDVPEYIIEVEDLAGADGSDVKLYLKDVRRSMSHRLFPLDQWPQWEIKATRLSTQTTRLHISIDGILVDDRSYQILIREWFKIYYDSRIQLPNLEYSFKQYVLDEKSGRESESYRQSLAYWKQRITTLPSSPALPFVRSSKSIKQAKFTRYQERLKRSTWRRIKELCLTHRITPPGLLLSCFIEVLSYWSKTPELTVNVPTLNRLPFHDDINHIVGEFGSFILVGNDSVISGTFLSRIKKLQKRLWEGLEHERVSGVRVMRELISQKHDAGIITMPVVFTMASNLADADARVPVDDEQSAEVSFGITQTPQIFLDHQASEIKEELRFNWDVIEDLFPSGLIEDMFSTYVSLLKSIANNESVLENLYPLDIPEAQREVRCQVNSTEKSLPSKMLHDVANRAAGLDKTALISDEHDLSYMELDQLSSELAGVLKERAVCTGDRVAVIADKGWQQIVSVLAVLKTGAAYVPISAEDPHERQRLLLDDTGAKIILTQVKYIHSLEKTERTCIPIDTLSDDMARVKLTTVEQGPDNLAYVIYTSGSTGIPKGVMISHQSAVNTILDINDRFCVGENDRIIGLSSLTFDLSVYDIFGSFMSGATLVLPDSMKQQDPAYLLGLMIRHSVTIWNSVPALMEVLVQYAEDNRLKLPPTLRLVLLSGDWIPVGMPKRIRELCESVEIVSLGGATEASIWSIYHPADLSDDMRSSIPYGKPLANQKFHILNHAGNDCPEWVPGRLFIEGTGLAIGYLNNQSRTDEKFNRYSLDGKRLYDTGDLGRYMPDGNIEFLGRSDRQIKVNGYRIELGEVESHLQNLPSVRRAVAVKNDRNQLWAFVVCDGSVSEHSLLDKLKQSLPTYMLPGRIECLDEFPLTANGKIDQKALLKLEKRPDERRSQKTSGLEQNKEKFIEIISSALGKDSIDLESSLFEMGATSVDIIRISNCVRRDVNSEFPIEAYYTSPTISALLDMLSQNHGGEQNPDNMTDGKFNAYPETSFNSAYSDVTKKSKISIRTGLESMNSVQLVKDNEKSELLDLFGSRLSCRQFSLRPVSFHGISALLINLSCLRVLDSFRFLYASAGGLYANHIYVYAKPGRVHGLAGGMYYYQPVQHRLYEIAESYRVDRTAYGDQNRLIYDQGAFCIFLVCPIDSIKSVYGEWGYGLAMYEAGSIGQLLRDKAPELGLGICSIGTLDFSGIRRALKIDDTHILLHSWIGGNMRRNVADPRGLSNLSESTSELSRTNSILERLNELSDSETERLLRALESR